MDEDKGALPGIGVLVFFFDLVCFKNWQPFGVRYPEHLTGWQTWLHSFSSLCSFSVLYYQTT